MIKNYYCSSNGVLRELWMGSVLRNLTQYDAHTRTQIIIIKIFSKYMPTVYIKSIHQHHRKNRTLTIHQPLLGMLITNFAS